MGSEVITTPSFLWTFLNLYNFFYCCKMWNKLDPKEAVNSFWAPTGFVLNLQSLSNFLVEGIHWPLLSNCHSFYQYSNFYTQENALILCNHSIGFHLIMRSSLSFCSLCEFEEAWHLMVIDSRTGVFQVENGLSFPLLRDRVEEKVVCVRYLMLRMAVEQATWRKG